MLINILDKLHDINDIMIEQELKNLTPIECLLKIMKENKKYKEENEKNSTRTRLS